MRKRKILCVVISMVLVLSVSFCGKPDPSDEITTSEAEEITTKEISKETTKETTEETKETETSEEETERIPTTESPVETGEFDGPVFDKTDYPVVDGSTATKPLAKAFYEAFTGEKIDEVTHSKTHQAYLNLLNHDADLILVVDPSEDELKEAREKGIDLDIHKIVNEAFVFFVNSENPVKSLTVDQIRDIYSGKITNWKDVGGEDHEIYAYQRPVNSGSQTGMLELVMKDRKIMEAPEDKVAVGMGDIIDYVSDYDNGRYALGYSYYYYANTMYIGENCRMLMLNDVEPCNETIISGEYPVLTRYIAVTRAEEKDPKVTELLQAMLSDYGQQAAKDAGYVPIRPLDETEDDKGKDQDPEEIKTLDLNDEFQQNPIRVMDNSEIYRDIPISYPVADGFSDPEHQNRVNAFLKERTENYVDPAIDLIQDPSKDQLFIDGRVVTCFADILGMEFDINLLDAEGVNIYRKHYDLCLDLRKIEDLSFYDIFIPGVKASDILKESVHQSLMVLQRNAEEQKIEDSIYLDPENVRLDLSRKINQKKEIPFLIKQEGIYIPAYEDIYTYPEKIFISFEECPDQVVIYDRYKNEPSLYSGTYKALQHIPVALSDRNLYDFKGISNAFELRERSDHMYQDILMHINTGYEDPEVFLNSEAKERIIQGLRSYLDERRKEKAPDYCIEGVYIHLDPTPEGEEGYIASLFVQNLSLKDETSFNEACEKVLYMLRHPEKYLVIQNQFLYNFTDEYPQDQQYYDQLELSFDRDGNPVSNP